LLLSFGSSATRLGPPKLRKNQRPFTWNVCSMCMYRRSDRKKNCRTEAGNGVIFNPKEKVMFYVRKIRFGNVQLGVFYETYLLSVTSKLAVTSPVTGAGLHCSPPYFLAIACSQLPHGLLRSHWPSSGPPDQRSETTTRQPQWLCQRAQHHKWSDSASWGRCAPKCRTRT
jgi:hypothetical protein